MGMKRKELDDVEYSGNIDITDVEGLQQVVCKHCKESWTVEKEDAPSSNGEAAKSIDGTWKEHRISCKKLKLECLENGNSEHNNVETNGNGVLASPSVIEIEPVLLKDKAVGETVPLVKPTVGISKPAPDFSGTAIVNGEFKELKLSDYRGKYLVFFFYPLDFTFVCPTEIIAFSDRVAEFRQINTEVVACSVDSPFTHLAWINTPRKDGGLGPINLPILSDLTHQIAKDYGVYLQDAGHTLRGLFIIDDKGILRQITMNDLPVGRSVDETIRLVQAFQYTDKHGEVCPAGWKPGSETIIPNPEDKLKYFKKMNEEKTE